MWAFKNAGTSIVDENPAAYLTAFLGWCAFAADLDVKTIRVDTVIAPNYFEADPEGKKIGAKVGRFLEYDELRKMTEGVPNTEAYRLIAARVQHEIENMRDGKRDKFDVPAVRKAWKAERRKSRKQEPVIDE